MLDVSVVIPCHDAEPWLRQTLGSLLAQSHPPVEVVVVDDRSTDRSVEVARSFGDSIRIETADFGNAAQTRNHGASMVSGEAIMFMDADDVIGPEVIASLVAEIERHPEGIAACPWYRLERVAERWVRRPPSCTPRRPGQDTLDAWLRGWYHPPCSVLWSRAAWERVDAWDPRAGVNDDGEIMMRSFALGVSLHLTSAGESFYRRMPDGGESLSGRRRTESGLEARLYVVVKIARILRERGQLGRYRAALGRALSQILWDAEGDFPEIASSCRSYRREFGEAPWLRIGRGLVSRTRSLLRTDPESGTVAHRGPEDEIRHGLEEQS